MEIKPYIYDKIADVVLPLNVILTPIAAWCWFQMYTGLF